MPTLPTNRLERDQSAMCLSVARALWTAGPPLAFLALGSPEEQAAALTRDEELITTLLRVAAEPLLRRQFFVPGEARFSISTMNSLFSQISGFTGTVTNVYANFRFRLIDLHRLRLGDTRPPSGASAPPRAFILGPFSHPRSAHPRRVQYTEPLPRVG